MVRGLKSGRGICSSRDGCDGEQSMFGSPKHVQMVLGVQMDEKCPSIGITPQIFAGTFGLW